MRFAELLYRAVLRAYPRQFRLDVGPELLVAFRQGLVDRGRPRHAFLVREIIDLVRNIPAEWLGRLPRLPRHAATRRQGTQQPLRLLPPLLNDARIAARGFLRRPGFAAAAVLTFAIGIGANTAVFALLHTILFDPLPFKEVDRLVAIAGNSMVREAGEGAATYPDIRDWPRLDLAFEGVSAFSSGVRFLLEGGQAPERVQGAFVSANFLEVMGADPILGRGFLPDEEGEGAERVVLIGEGLWRSRFGADPRIVGKPIAMGGGRRIVVGVMPEHFRFPLGSVVWVPTMSGRSVPRTLRHLEAVGRLASGISMSQGRAVLGDALDGLGGRGAREDITAVPLRDWIFGGQKAPVLIFYAVVSLVLLVACLNVASLFLARNETRRHELAVRVSLGAGRLRLAREMLTESLVLAVIGGGLGIGIGWFGRDMILAVLPDEIPPYFSFEISTSVLFVMTCIVLTSGIFFGLVPWFAARRSDLSGLLANVSRTFTHGRSRRRFWSSLVAVEIALALTVLISANLMVKSLLRQLGADTGFDANSIVTLYATPDYSGERVWEFYERVTEAVSSTPGFTSVGLAFELDTGDNFHWWAAYIAELGGVRDVRYQRCDPGYFSAMGIPLMAGRIFDQHDNFAAPRVIMVNRSFAERYWPGENPVGKRLGRGAAPASQQNWHEVIGVVADVHNAGYGRAAEPQVFLPYAQAGLDYLHVIARTTLDTPVAMRSLREIIRAIDPQVPLSRFRTMEQAIRQANWQVPFATWAFGLLSIVALVLAATGVYGLVAFSITQRARDLAIRVAVGADAGGLQRMVVGESLTTAVAGVLAGVVLAVAGMRLVVSMLFLVGPTDPAVYAISTAVMITTVLISSYLPARGILRLDPMTVLGRE